MEAPLLTAVEGPDATGTARDETVESMVRGEDEPPSSRGRQSSASSAASDRSSRSSWPSLPSLSRMRRQSTEIFGGSTRLTAAIPMENAAALAHGLQLQSPWRTPLQL